MQNVFRAILLVALAVPLGAQGQATDAHRGWREWRGGAQQGSSPARNLPADFGSGTLQWKVPVPGRGVSSPIVVGDRVFVSTAHRHVGGLLLVKSATVVGCSVLALLAGAVLLLGGGVRGRAGGWLWWVDRGVTVVITCGFVALALVADFAPDALWALGRPGEAWLISGSILQLGLAAASGWSRPGGRLRLIACGGLLAIGALLWFGVPLDRYGIQHGVRPRALMVAPGVLFATWSMAAACLGRWLSRRSTRPLPSRGGSGSTAAQRLLGAGGACVAGAALVLFGSVNGFERDDRLARSLLCYDLASGALLWERVLLVADQEQKWPQNSYATPTPCSDGERVFAYFGGGWGCTDLFGSVLWTGTDPEYAPSSRYGAGASPIVVGDQVLLWQENEGKSRRSYLLALDLLTGAQNWRVQMDDVHDSYSTPILVPRLDGSLELVTMAYRKLVAHSVAGGGRLWELPLPARQMVPSLCYAGDDLLLVSGGTHLEFSTSGIKLIGAGPGTVPQVLWQTRRNLSDVCSPVVAGGLYFTVIDGRLRCLDPQTGKVLWVQRIGSTDYWASLVAGDGKLYALSGEGLLTVVAVEAGACRILAESDLGEPCMATPALVEGRVIVRTEGHLCCYAGGGH